MIFYHAMLFSLPFQDSAWSKSQDASRSTGQPAELSDTPRGAQPSARHSSLQSSCSSSLGWKHQRLTQEIAWSEQHHPEPGLLSGKLLCK